MKNNFRCNEGFGTQPALSKKVTRTFVEPTKSDSTMRLYNYLNDISEHGSDKSIVSPLGKPNLKNDSTIFYQLSKEDIRKWSLVCL